MTGYWVGVACAAHVRRGRSGGFMQLGHGKAAPLKRVKPGDRIVYYSPTVTLGGKDKLQAVTAIGTVKDREPYVFDMGKGFKPFRRDVTWTKAQETPVRPLLDQAGIHVRQIELGLSAPPRAVCDQRRGLSFDCKGDGRRFLARHGRTCCLARRHPRQVFGDMTDTWIIAWNRLSGRPSMPWREVSIMDERREFVRLAT